MTADDVIAYVYPAVGTEGYSGAEFTIRMNERSLGYVAPRRRRPQVLDSLHTLESLYCGPPDIFRAGMANTEDILDLGHVGLLSRRRTEVSTGMQTPASRPTTAVAMRKKLGQGNSAVVYRVWNVSTGEQYALKKPIRRSFDAAAWEREAVIMDRIHHKHIVSLLNPHPSHSESAPWFHLEYMPKGSIGDHLEARRYFSHYECKQILAQTLDALDYLHTLDPQIVHRDAKPEKILILYRRSDAIFVKFADFGLSHEGDTLKSICGTYLYLAPEIYEAETTLWEEEERASYTTLVDIWSLGVVLAKLVCGLPKHGGQNVRVNWCKSVRQRVEIHLRVKADNLLSLLLESMLCLQPEARKTAKDCLKEPLLFLYSTEESSGVSGHYSDSFENEASTIRLGETQKIDSEITDTGNGDPSTNSSSLNAYIITNPEGHVRSDAFTPKSTLEYVGQLLSKLDDPEDSLFYKSSFGEDSNNNYSNIRGSQSASTIIVAYDNEPQNEEAEGSPRSMVELAAPPEIEDLEARPSETLLQVFLTNAINTINATVKDTGKDNEADTTLSFKRLRSPRYLKLLTPELDNPVS